MLGYIMLGHGGHGKECKLYLKFSGKALKETGEEHDLVFIFKRSLCSKFILSQNYPDDKALSRENDNSSADTDLEEGTGFSEF